MAGPPRSRLDKLVWLIQRAIPWVSLAVGIVGAILMDRGPERGRIVAIVALVSWVVLMIVLWLERSHVHAGPEQEPSKLTRTIRFSVLMLTQSSLHLQLYFVLPFYFKAYAGTFPHMVFMGILCGASLASLWDPLTEWLLVRTRVGLLYPAFATFCVMTAVLPALGLSTGLAVWTGAAAAGLGLPVMVFADHLHGRPLVRALVTALVVALVFPTALLLGAIRAVPAVPMQLVHAEIGTRRAGYDVVNPVDQLDQAPRTLVCATAIFAPVGVHEGLFHVWRKEGEVMDRIPLEITGGREAGFRTYSVKHNFGDAPEGEWSCAVETEMGQFLGARTVIIGSP